uniref:Kazal-like domain-containing protein n=1 Tax=Podarcis muralis TaxID=64176 RepID=A0A670IJC7_PODMU
MWTQLGEYTGCRCKCSHHSFAFIKRNDGCEEYRSEMGPNGELTCTRENAPVRDATGYTYNNKCIMCSEKLGGCNSWCDFFHRLLTSHAKSEVSTYTVFHPGSQGALEQSEDAFQPGKTY